VEAARSGHHALYFLDCEERLREFVRLDPWELSYLDWAAARARREIVEIGRLHGGSTLALALANPNACEECSMVPMIQGPRQRETIHRAS